MLDLHSAHNETDEEEVEDEHRRVNFEVEEVKQSQEHRENRRLVERAPHLQLLKAPVEWLVFFLL